MAPTAATSVFLQRRVRPIRLAFLIQPDDACGLERAIGINSSIWGGIYNLIVPAYKKSPVWHKHSVPKLSAKKIVTGYLSAFEPDFIVEMEKGLAKYYGIEQHILSPKSILISSEISYAVGMQALYLGIPKSNQIIINIKPSGNSSDLLMSAWCGDFPQETDFQYIKRSFESSFRIDEVEIQNDSIIKLQQQTSILTPLTMTLAGLEKRVINRFHGFVDTSIFLLNSRSVSDIIDFWNIRACGWKVVAMPIEHTDLLFEDCLKIVARNNEIWQLPTAILGAQSIDRQYLSDFASRLGKSSGSPVTCFLQPPRIWSSTWKAKDVGRLEVFSSEIDIELGANGEQLIPGNSPSFISKRSKGASHWANVFKLQSVGLNHEVAAVLPSNLANVGKLIERPQLSDVRQTSEGIVAICSEIDTKFRWYLPDGQTVMRSWLEQQGYKAQVDVKGKIVLQLIRTFGNLDELSKIQSAELLQLLNKMAHGLVEFPIDEQESSKTKTRTRSRFVARQTWIKVLQAIHANKIDAVVKHLSFLTDNGVLKIGLTLCCEICDHTNWYGTNDIGDQLKCERCLSISKFPAANPPNDKNWQYRTQGVFSVDNYLHGGYSVALTLRFLLRELQAEGSWIPTFKLEGLTDREVDIDLAILWRAKFQHIEEPILILAECKSFFDEFKSNDLRRAKILAKQFPRSIIVFSTLRDKLSQNECASLKKLISSIRTSHPAEIAPIIILTATELLSREGIPKCWKTQIDISGNDIHGLKSNPNRIYELCRLTQQLHINP